VLPSVAIVEVADNLEGSKFVHDPDPTKNGITQGVYDAYRHLNGKPLRTVALIDRAEVIAIYNGNYWIPLNASNLPHGVDFALFQFGVNVGTGKAARIFQGILGVPQDGIIGPKTIAAAKRLDPVQLTDQVFNAQDAYYDKIYEANPTRNEPYIKGWHNRVKRARAFLAGQSGNGGLVLLALVLGGLLLAGKS